MLETINIHGNENRIIIYPIIGAKSVDGYFPVEIKDDIIFCIGKYVEVFGEIIYNTPASAHPKSIKIDHIQVLYDGNENDLPSLKDLKGIAPDITGNLKSEEFVRKLRNESW